MYTVYCTMLRWKESTQNTYGVGGNFADTDITRKFTHITQKITSH